MIMKKISTLFCTAALISALSAGLVSCSDEPDGYKTPANGIKPVLSAGNTGSELTAFFDSNLNYIARALFSEYNMGIWGMSVFLDTCVMINSVNEFDKIEFIDDIPPVELPFIDFDAYTLVIGKYFKSHKYINFVAQHVVVEQGEIIMNIILEDLAPDDAILYEDQGRYFYWGLYPKLPELPIKIIKIKIN
jgi:hypothetical protein